MEYDLLIIGGGINGAAIAREAALNGWSVLLVEKDDLASHTSSASTKLIHGGLRYLEYYEFGLVREGLRERERLLKAAPHLIRPRPFVLPHEHAVRPWWMVRAGLLLYDLLGGRSSLPRSRGLRRSDTAFLAPLRGKGKGFVYGDCWVDDARLVVLNAIDAARHGAEIATRTALVSARRIEGGWEAQLSDGRSISARAIANAAGPWVCETLALTGAKARAGVKLVKGSHIVVPALFAGDHAYMLQQPDRRIVFAIAYRDNTTLIGTTDEAVERPGDAQVAPHEIDYLCAAANRYFTREIAPADVIATFCGVRPLYDDGASEASANTRDYVLELDTNGAPILSAFGGKITTARHLAEEAVGKLGEALGRAIRPVTRDAHFPGGDLLDPKSRALPPRAKLDRFLAAVRARYPFLGEARSLRMARAYGTMLHDMIGDAGDMGEELGGGLGTREVDWLIAHEWAQTTDDILMRRTKLGLLGDTDLRQRLERYLASRFCPTRSG